MDMLTLQEIDFSYENHSVLQSVSFTVQKGEFLTVAGANGVGKTTLLKILAGMLKPAAGNVFLEGAPVLDCSYKRRARTVAYVPSRFMPAYSFTVYEFVMMGRYPHRSGFSLPSAEDRSAVALALSRTGMEAFLERKIPSLSTGEMQRVLIAAGIAQSSHVLLLDEPLTGLDPHFQNQMRILLEEIKETENKTIIMASHDLNGSALLSDTVIGLKDGAIHFNGSPKDFMTTPVLRDIYGEEFELVLHPARDIHMIVPGRKLCA